MERDSALLLYKRLYMPRARILRVSVLNGIPPVSVVLSVLNGIQGLTVNPALYHPVYDLASLLTRYPDVHQRQ